MNNQTLISVENVSKRFCRDLKRSLWYGIQDIAAEFALHQKTVKPHLRDHEFWAVDNVSFELRRGECLGLLGANGGGKSTILKLLNGLVKPDHGQIITRGRVGALIELGAGFSPVLTGRENIYVNGAVLGLSRREIDAKFDDIVEFAELKEFMNAPVQSYSTGMRVRLGFAVAAHLDPDILLIDEVLAVGDAGFRAKCYNRITELVKKCAVIIVSHNMSHVARLASRALVLNKGKVEFIGNTAEAINAYYSLFLKQAVKTRHGSQKAVVYSIQFITHKGEVTESLEFGKPFAIKIKATAHEPVGDLVVNVVFQTIGQEVVAQCNNYVIPHTIHVAARCDLSINMQIDCLNLNPGVYQVSCLLMSADMTTHYDWQENIFQIAVKGGRPAGGALQFIPKWSVETTNINSETTLQELS